MKRKGENMKNKAILAGLVLAVFGLNLNADVYIGVGYSKSADSRDKILGMKASDIVGKGGAYNSLQFGIYTPPTKDEIGAKVFLEVWTNRQKFNEKGIAIGGQAEKRMFDAVPLNVYFGAKGGYGVQSNKGKTRLVENAQSALGYIVGFGSADGLIEYKSNTKVLDLALMTGISYNVTKNISVDLGYVGRSRNYSMQYAIKGAPFSRTNVNSRAWENSVMMTLNFIYF
jgi:hypothetical protein